MHLRHILNDDHGSFGAAERLKYVTAISSACAKLESMPYRFTRITIAGRKYHRFTHKAHNIFYRVFEAKKLVSIDAVLHGHQETAETFD